MNSRKSSISHRSGQSTSRETKRDSLTQSNDVSSQPISSQMIEEDTDDEDVMLLKDFDEYEARQTLLMFKDSDTVFLSQETQKEIGIEVGVNVTAENPWKKVKKSAIVDNVTDESRAMTKIRNRIGNSDMEFVLVGYIPTVSDKGDQFLFFQNDDTAREASEIIDKLEALERLKSNKSIFKRIRPWKSLGSEQEVDYIVYRENKKPIDVDIQSIYNVNHPHGPFTQRMVADARDGYIELVQKKTVFTNLIRRRVDMPIQSASFRVTTEQQTDPTFPSDEWSQYLYEIVKNEEEEMAAEGEVAKPKLKHGALPEPIYPSFQVKELLETLEFNEIDMYRNDYPYVAKKQVPKCKTFNLKEAFCFVELSQSIGQIVCSVAWNPKFSSTLLTSYTSNTLCTQINNCDRTDNVKRTVLQPNIVLLWSFDDIFRPQLHLNTPLEVTCLSFCPYDENLVIGGLVNGQLIMWNMTNRLSNLEKEMTAQMKADMKKKSLRTFLGWGEDNQFRFVQPVGLTFLTTTHRAPITAIEWFGRKHYVETTGNIKENVDPNDDKEYRFFLTTSLDGSISFWDVDFSSDDKKKEETSILRQKYNANCGPVYSLVFNRPITGILFDNGIFKYQPKVIPKNRKFFNRVEHSVHEVHQEDFRNRLIVSTLTGELALLSLDFVESIPESKIPKGKIRNPEMFANVHDGPIVNISRNSFLNNIFLTIGRQIVALWHEEQTHTPIFWRYSKTQLTNCKWSTDKPSVFFLTTVDGNFEAWDLLSRTDGPCLRESLGGSILTLISQHMLSLPTALSTVGVGDYNSNLRILMIPETLSSPKENETEMLKSFIERNVERKNTRNDWQKHFYNTNGDIREAKLRNCELAKQEMERFEKELRDQEDERIKKEEEDIKREKLKGKSLAHYDFAEKLSRKWDEMNMKRMMSAVLAKKFIDPEVLEQWSKPEKDRIAYNQQKQKAIAESFSKINEDIVELRARLLPVETDNDDRVTIITRNIAILDEVDYESLKENSMNIVNSLLFNQLDYLTILKRGRERRQIINDSLSLNNKRRPAFYIKKRKEDGISEIQINGKT